VENKVRLELTHHGQVARITLAAPKANIVDKAMMLGLSAALDAHDNAPIRQWYEE